MTYQAYLEQMQYLSLTEGRLGYIDQGKDDYHELLPSLNLPVWVIWGKQDKIDLFGGIIKRLQAENFILHFVNPAISAIGSN